MGMGIARAGLSQKLGRGTTLILAVSSNLPDIDVACLFGGPLAFLWRRTPTHSLLGATVLVLVATCLFRRYYPNLSWPVIFGLTALGVAGHLFADLWNAYGVVLFWPFDWRRVSLNWVYIIDIFIWGVLIVSWLVSGFWRSKTMRVWQIGLCMLGIYIGVCARCSQLSLELVRTRAPINNPIHIYPEPFGPQRFRVVLTTDDDYVHYLVHPFREEVKEVETLAIEKSTPIVAAARQTDAAHRLDSFFSTPVWRESSDHKAAVVFGMEFRSLVFNHGKPFVFRVTPEGQVSHERWVGPDAN
jgi:membrane-bound metal-dependent hydrolase YbcI (DUF457 family)